MVTVEEHSGFGGLGSLIAEIMAENDLKIPLRKIYLPEFIDRIGNQEKLGRFYGIASNKIADFIRSLTS